MYICTYTKHNLQTFIDTPQWFLCPCAQSELGEFGLSTRKRQGEKKLEKQIHNTMERENNKIDSDYTIIVYYYCFDERSDDPDSITHFVQLIIIF